MCGLRLRRVAARRLRRAAQASFFLPKPLNGEKPFFFLGAASATGLTSSAAVSTAWASLSASLAYAPTGGWTVGTLFDAIAKGHPGYGDHTFFEGMYSQGNGYYGVMYGS